jgi:hypothetical protein
MRILPRLSIIITFHVATDLGAVATLSAKPCMKQHTFTDPRDGVKVKVVIVDTRKNKKSARKGRGGERCSKSEGSGAERLKLMIAPRIFAIVRLQG